MGRIDGRILEPRFGESDCSLTYLQVRNEPHRPIGPSRRRGNGPSPSLPLVEILLFPSIGGTKRRGMQHSFHSAD